MKKQKTLKDLNLIDRFLFAEVMEDVKTGQDILSIILGQDIQLISGSQTEKEYRISPLAKSIRMDVFSVSEEGIVYDIEAQGTYRSDLRKRSRYYQSLMDGSLLESGENNYNLLKDSFIIVITNYDIFDLGKYCYTFEAVCREHPALLLRDGATRIFLNTRGTNKDEVSSELVDFLHYMENSTDEMVLETGSVRIRRIHERVCKVRQSEAIGMKFMRELEEKSEARAEGCQAGLTDGILTSIKNLMETMDLTAEKAMKALKVPEEEWEKYLRLLEK
ncbi:Rpn family recombination-promoting nuclease/putative transposase [Frisingicoccus sp.]|uniref:Rpn family recombination-promoting nuclease/putative transposase n=1 Tax=Frisingicoccus sp. TaxID=1918627 RepID=UPI003AB81CB8